jgi:hypothetical protein
MVYRG